MSKYLVDGSDLTSVANAIRTKGGTGADLSFPNEFVSAIGAIPTGGSSTLITKSITANGTYDASDDSADGYSQVTVNVPSKLVTGTFTGSTTAAAMSITVPYTGSGYPVAGVIYPSTGTFKTDSAIALLAQQYAIYLYAFAKNDVSSTPTYSGSSEENKSEIITLYKYSNSDPSSNSTSRGHLSQNYNTNNAAATASNCVRINSATQISVYIAGTSYGFPAGIEFTYHLIYSS